jgi:hypothetical protein
VHCAPPRAGAAVVHVAVVRLLNAPVFAADEYVIGLCDVHDAVKVRGHRVLVASAPCDIRVGTAGYIRLPTFMHIHDFPRLRRGEKKNCNIIIIIIIVIIINIATVVAEVSRALGRILFSMIMTRKKIYVIFISRSSVNIMIKRKKRFRNARRRHDLRYYYNIIHCNLPVASVTVENFACWNKKNYNNLTR